MAALDDMEKILLGDMANPRLLAAPDSCALAPEPQLTNGLSAASAPCMAPWLSSMRLRRDRKSSRSARGLAPAEEAWLRCVAIHGVPSGRVRTGPPIEGARDGPGRDLPRPHRALHDALARGGHRGPRPPHVQRRGGLVVLRGLPEERRRVPVEAGARGLRPRALPALATLRDAQGEGGGVAPRVWSLQESGGEALRGRDARAASDPPTVPFPTCQGSAPPRSPCAAQFCSTPRWTNVFWCAG